MTASRKNSVHTVVSMPKMSPPFMAPVQLPPNGKRVLVRIGAPEWSGSFTDSMLGSDLPLSFPSVELDREDIPREVLASHETPQTSPDISGRVFSVLVCVKPEFKTLFNSGLSPSDKAKNAWLMLDEFVNFDMSDDSDWDWCLRQFLNR